MLVHGLILREAGRPREVATVELGSLERSVVGLWRVRRGSAVLQSTVVGVERVVQVEGGVVAPEEGRGGLGWVQTLRVRMLVYSEHGDGVAVGVHAGTGWVGRHLARTVNPAWVMDWQHYPLLPAVDWVAGFHAHWPRVPLLLFFGEKRRK